MNKNKKILFSHYKPGINTIKKAKKILHDALAFEKKLHFCSNCAQPITKYNYEVEALLCQNSNCSMPSKFFSPLHGCKLNLEQIELLIQMIIDMQDLNEIFLKLKIVKSVIKKWRSRLIEQVEWSKYKIDKDVIDLQEIYANIVWQWS